ncbi:MAG: ABC transporter permease [Alphaproteobacteria bacterium]|nr:ABC transporter permease [Alphaproteobacteria bacterium]MDA7983447.1 ABC transporter permease [Alphaproteobacteria bacterium]MDA7988970.1 ABC transporter permease [Alphaproteobacteria bacterium]MDA8010277.1 ABC transporter permease [Alphaproteobacteria bacterium]
MPAYAAKRILLALLTIFLAVTLMFIMIRAIPGDPVSILLGPRATPELKAALIERLALDKPLYTQLFIFYRDLLQGDLGLDVFSNRSVTAIVFEQLPFTLELIFAAILWSALLGLALGLLAAARPNTRLDKALAILSTAFVAAPAFVVALLSLLLFSVHLQWLPAIGAGESGNIPDRLYHLVLPSFAIGLSWVGYIARIVRASFLEVLGEDHIRTARAFGVAERKILLSYAFRVGILPVITLLGVGMAFLLSAAVFTEIVFARPGIGQLVISSINSRNYPVVMGSVLVSSVIFVVSTTISDLVNAMLDPRIRSAL